MYKKHLSVFLLFVFFVVFVFSCKKETSSNNTAISESSSQSANKVKPPTATKSIYVTGLNDPRGLKFGPDGNLYVAEAGVGGTISSATFHCEQAPPPFGPYFGSPTGGRVSKIVGGVRTTVTTQLPTAISSIQDKFGAADVAFIDNVLYVLETGGGCSRGLPANPSGIYRVNSNGTTSLVADLS